MTAVPLRRNRDFVLLQTGQLLSDAGSQLTAVAYPLLVLAATGSAAQAGLVSFARLLPLALLALPAGLAADRWSRKRLMVAADVVRALAVGALAAAVGGGEVAIWAIGLAAFVEGAGAAVFHAAEAGALRAVVPVRQLPAAAGVVPGRQAVVSLAGPPLGGALFAVARGLPFLVDAVSYAFSTVSLLAMRAPFEASREPERAPVWARLVEGFRFLWGHPFLRTTAFLYGLTNVLGPGLLLALVVVAERQGVSAGAIGALVSAFAAGLLVGSLVSPLARRRLPVRAVLLLELWAWLGCAAFLLWPSVYVLALGMLPAALAIPSTDSVVVGYRLALTPDRLLGRSESVRRSISLLLAPVGPLAAGVLLGAFSARATVGVFAAVALVLAAWGTLSPVIRSAPSVEDLGDGDELAPPGGSPASVR